MNSCYIVSTEDQTANYLSEMYNFCSRTNLNEDEKEMIYISLCAAAWREDVRTMGTVLPYLTEFNPSARLFVYLCTFYLSISMRSIIKN